MRLCSLVIICKLIIATIIKDFYRLFLLYFSGGIGSAIVDNNFATDYTNMLLLTRATKHLLFPIPRAVSTGRLSLSLGRNFGKFNCDQCSKRL